MFCEQSEVDSFVSAYPKPGKVTKVNENSVGVVRFVHGFFYTEFSLYFKPELQ